ncbi:MAG: hypothetical protein ABI895_09885 [Deltaproteobacteria bacterium]
MTWLKWAAPSGLLFTGLACGGSATSRDRERPVDDTQSAPAPEPECTDGECPASEPGMPEAADPLSGPEDICGADSTQGRTLLVLTQSGLDAFAGCERIAGSLGIVSNLSGPARLSMCPWTSDGVCDEVVGDCAQGSDGSDCSGYEL